MKRLTFSVVLLFILQLAIAETPFYHETIANSGDGVYSLLRRYQLVNYNCNIQAFYSLNELKKGDMLHSGKKYKLPILIYKYNGQSIRSTIKDQDWDKALRIKGYNEKILEKGLRRKSFSESKILWVPYHELYCSQQQSKIKTKSALEPKDGAVSTKPSLSKKMTRPGASVKHVPLFGPDFSNVEIIDNSLKNRVFYIVSGHGGPDPGAMCTTCPTTLCEDEYAYDVALRLTRNLTQHGAIVEMIIQDKNDGIRTDKDLIKCDKDEKCMGTATIPINQRKRLAQRTQAVNNLSRKHKMQGLTDQTVVIIHVDSRNEGTRQDVFFYHLEGSKKGKSIANNIQSTFKAKYDKFQKGRGYKGTVKARSLYVIRNTNPPAVFIELANIRNQADQKRIVKASNRQALANWIFEGITKQ